MSAQTITRSGNDFTITRTFQAPLDTVWETWTTAEHFERWFNAKPGSVELDVRAGGRWQATVDTPYGELELAGVYLEVTEHERLIWTLDLAYDPVVMSVRFSERDGETIAVYGQNVAGGHTRDEATDGASGILDSFDGYLTTVLEQRS